MCDDEEPSSSEKVVKFKSKGKKCLRKRQVSTDSGSNGEESGEDLK